MINLNQTPNTILNAFSYLVFYSIPFVYWRKNLKISNLEKWGILLGILGSFYDNRTLIYSSFIFFLVLQKNKDLYETKYIFLFFLIQLFLVIHNILLIRYIYG